MNKGNENIEKLIKNIADVKEIKCKIYQDVLDIFRKYDVHGKFQDIEYSNVNGYHCDIKFNCGWLFDIDMLIELQEYFGVKGFISGSEGDGRVIGFTWRE